MAFIDALLRNGSGAAMSCTPRASRWCKPSPFWVVHRRGVIEHQHHFFLFFQRLVNGFAYFVGLARILLPFCQRSSAA